MKNITSFQTKIGQVFGPTCILTTKPSEKHLVTKPRRYRCLYNNKRWELRHYLSRYYSRRATSESIYWRHVECPNASKNSYFTFFNLRGRGCSSCPLSFSGLSRGVCGKLFNKITFRFTEPPPQPHPTKDSFGKVQNWQIKQWCCFLVVSTTNWGFELSGGLTINVGRRTN